MRVDCEIIRTAASPDERQGLQFKRNFGFLLNPLTVFCKKMLRFKCTESDLCQL